MKERRPISAREATFQRERTFYRGFTSTARGCYGPVRDGLVVAATS